jgi:hypothetical protein
MTANQFRHLALSFSDATENSHQAHPDFRVRGRVFATLRYPDAGWGMVKLTPEQQEEAIRAFPGAFQPAAGMWGKSGSTVVRLSTIEATDLLPILRQAYDNSSRRKRSSRTSR